MFQITGVIHELNTQFIEIPYSGDNNPYFGDPASVVSMYVFLPNAIDEFLENVTPELLDQVFVDGQSQHKRWSKVDIELPKFSLKQKIDLTPVNINLMPIFLHEKNE